MSDPIWHLERGDGPLIAAAIHDGHALRAELQPLTGLTDAERLREEDPFTAGWAGICPTRIVGLRSRFEVDLNRPRKQAIYRRPEDAWGLTVWRGELPEPMARRSLAEYDAFYAALDDLLERKLREHRRLALLDIHSYNHRRGGPAAPVDDPELNPQVNLGTGIEFQAPWRGLIDRFIAELSGFDFPGGRMDVRENVKFKGGHMSRHIRARWPDRVCILSVEFKKFFMDEWTGEADPAKLDAVREALRSTLPGIAEELERT